PAPPTERFTVSRTHTMYVALRFSVSTSTRTGDVAVYHWQAYSGEQLTGGRMSTNQTVCRLLIGNELRRSREHAGYKQDEPAEHLGAKVSKISRLELGQTRVTVPEVKMLMEFYEADPAHTRGLLSLARGANHRGQWDGIRASLPNWFNTYVDLETEAEEIRWVQAEVIPGILQTEDYIRAVHAEALAASEDPAAIEDQITNRVDRQQVLHTERPPQVSFVLSESCLRREFGGSRVMKAQLHHLGEMAELH